MTDEELNRWLHENVLGEPLTAKALKYIDESCRSCGSSKLGEYRFVGETSCYNCDAPIPEREPEYEDVVLDVPNYCQSLDAVRAVEEKVVLEKRFGKSYFEHLCYATQDADWRPEYEKRTMVFCLDLTLATARQRAQACKLAWEEKG